MASIVLRCSTSEQALYRLLRLFYKSQSALTPLLLLSKSNPLRWASIWFWVQTWKCGVYSVAMLHVAAKSALRPRLFMPMAKKMSSARSLAPSFQIESAARDLAAAQRAKPFEPQEIERMITSADWTFRLPVVQKRSPLFIRQVRLSLRLSVSTASQILPGTFPARPHRMDAKGCDAMALINRLDNSASVSFEGTSILSNTVIVRLEDRIFLLCPL